MLRGMLSVFLVRIVRNTEKCRMLMRYFFNVEANIFSAVNHLVQRTKILI